MSGKLFLALLSASTAYAGPMRRAVDNTLAVGTSPISIASTSDLGTLTADNSCSHRDLGFFGKIAGEWYAVYGDTLFCAQPQTDPSQDSTQDFHGMVRDSVSKATGSPNKVHDLFLDGAAPVPHQRQFVPYNASWGEDSSWGFGGTSLCETDAAAREGVVFYLRNANAGGLQGAGVARVQVLDDGVPRVTQRYGDRGFWWDSATQPRYGDQLAYRDFWTEWIYAVGGAPTGVADQTASMYSYATRVKARHAHDLSQYQYFWGPDKGWSYEPLTQFDAETAIFWGAGQGQIVWNAHYQCYIFVHLSIVGDVFLLRTAHKPWGPWSPEVTAFNTGIASGEAAYAGVAHPYLDPSGKTLTVSYTHMPNDIRVRKITFA